MGNTQRDFRQRQELNERSQQSVEAKGSLPAALAPLSAGPVVTAAVSLRVPGPVLVATLAAVAVPTAPSVQGPFTSAAASRALGSKPGVRIGSSIDRPRAAPRPDDFDDFARSFSGRCPGKVLGVQVTAPRRVLLGRQLVEDERFRGAWIALVQFHGSVSVLLACATSIVAREVGASATSRASQKGVGRVADRGGRVASRWLRRARP